MRTSGSASGLLATTGIHIHYLNDLCKDLMSATLNKVNIKGLYNVHLMGVPTQDWDPLGISPAPAAVGNVSVEPVRSDGAAVRVE